MRAPERRREPKSGRPCGARQWPPRPLLGRWRPKFRARPPKLRRLLAGFLLRRNRLLARKLRGRPSRPRFRTGRPTLQYRQSGRLRRRVRSTGGLPTKLRQIFLPISLAHRRELVGAPSPTPPKLDWEYTPTHAPAPGLLAPGRAAPGWVAPARSSSCLDSAPEFGRNSPGRAGHIGGIKHSRGVRAFKHGAHVSGAHYDPI